jgi:hypothetical protein
MKQNIFLEKSSKLVNDLCEQGAAFPWENVDFYKTWLAQTNAFVQHSSTFLHLCHEGLAQGHPLKERFAEHIQEEAGHEKMTRNDLKFMQAQDSKVFEVSDVFWRSQYYWIKEVGATSHLGYIILLEGLAAIAGPQIFMRLQKSGYKGVTFFKVHTEEDQDHFREALDAVAVLNDTERDQIYKNLEESAKIYRMILTECVQANAKTKAA